MGLKDYNLVLRVRPSISSFSTLTLLYCYVYWCVQVIETDDDFENSDCGFDALVDFLDVSFPTKRPARQHNYIEVHVGYSGQVE